MKKEKHMNWHAFGRSVRFILDVHSQANPDLLPRVLNALNLKGCSDLQHTHIGSPDMTRITGRATEQILFKLERDISDGNFFKGRVGKPTIIESTQSAMLYLGGFAKDGEIVEIEAEITRCKLNIVDAQLVSAPRVFALGPKDLPQFPILSDVDTETSVDTSTLRRAEHPR